LLFFWIVPPKGAAPPGHNALPPMPVTVALSTQRSIAMMLQSKRADFDASAERRFIEFLSLAQSSVDIAAYDLRSMAVLATIADLRQRVTVRIIVDAGTEQRYGNAVLDPKPATTLEAVHGVGLASCVTPLYRDGKRAMHHKFAVRDREAVWTGGMNFTDGGFHLQDAGAIMLDSEELAAVYTAEFERLFTAAPVTDASMKSMVVGKGHKVMPLFGKQILQAILAELNGDVKRIRILAYACSHPQLIAAFQRFAKKGGNIRALYDPHGMHDAQAHNANARWFHASEHAVAAPSNRFHPYGESNLMAMKLLLIDDTVFIGSSNFADAFDTVDDNMLRIQSVQVATAATRYFDALASRYREANT
jgi:phosphatidylserine/phosphatidylglycerophosphate/cardiolipin synthase-like enzyme